MKLKLNEPVKIYMFHVRTPVHSDSTTNNVLIDDFGGMGGSSQTLNRYGASVEYQTMNLRYEENQNDVNASMFLKMLLMTFTERMI